MTISLLLGVLVGCSGCSPQPSETPEPVTPAQPVGFETELMADLAVPTHPDLDLGPLKEVTDRSAFYPGPTSGDWSAYRAWNWRTRDEWWPSSPQLKHFSVVDDQGARLDQIRPEGEVMKVFSSWQMKAVDGHYGVVAAAVSGQAEPKPLGQPELMIGAKDLSYTSVWTGMPVTVEVVGSQEVTVPAGTFEALRVRRSWGRANQRTTEERWWSREHGEIASVTRVETGDRVEGRMSVLASFGNVLEPQALRQVWDDTREAQGE